MLTQERLNTILVDSKGLKFDLLVTDEAQSINDDSRGVLLQSVIKECTSRNENYPEIISTKFQESPLKLFPGTRK